MKRHGLKFLKCGHIPAKADNEQQQQWADTKLKHVIKAVSKGKVHLLFLDAAYFMLQAFICCLCCTAGFSLRLPMAETASMS